MLRRPFGLLFTVVFVSAAYFYQAGGWNQNSRFNLTRAIIEQSTIRVDHYRSNTGDIARVGAHYYSDKAPGLSFAAVPSVATARGLLELVGRSTGDASAIAALSYVATVSTSALATAAGATALAWLVFVQTGSLPAAAFAALTFALATPTWAYATLFWGHSVANALVLVMCALAHSIGAGRLRPTVPNGLLVGLSGGWAVVTDYTAAPVVVLLASFTAWSLRRTPPDLLRVGAGLGAGAALCTAVLAGYNQAVTGSPFRFPYSAVQGWPGAQRGFLGITYPKLGVLFEICFGRFRGLLPLSPVLGFAALIPLLWRRSVHARPLLVVAVTAALYCVLLNASYAYWTGGWSYGPRHLSGAIGFLCLALGLLYAEMPRLRLPLIGLAGLSATMTLIAVATTVQPPESYRAPVAQLFLPAFFDGNLALNHQSFLEVGADPGALRTRVDRDAWNLGHLLGLRGLWSLLPLFFVWFACASFWQRGTVPEP